MHKIAVCNRDFISQLYTAILLLTQQSFGIVLSASTVFKYTATRVKAKMTNKKIVTESFTDPVTILLFLA
jgi:hypothetical protein